MQESNAAPTTPIPNPDICTIRIMFPVESDEQAIEYKKKITTVLSEIANAQIQFSIMNTPQDRTLGSSIR